MLCRVNVSATLEEHSIHVEDYDQQNTLLYAVEGEDPVPVTREAWRGYMRKHPECPPGSIYLHLPQTPLPPWRTQQVMIGFVWLVTKIFKRKVRRMFLRQSSKITS
jgi:hypothetical protein